MGHRVVQRNTGRNGGTCGATMVIDSRRLPPVVPRRAHPALSEADEATVAAAYTAARRRLLLLDYDGTLVPFAADRREATPSPRVRFLLEALCAAPENHVILISGRTKDDLVAWFDAFRMTLVAEHGAWVHLPGLRQWDATARLDSRWKSLVLPLLQEYVGRVAGSTIEEKETAVAWHYRAVDPSVAGGVSRDLTRALERILTDHDLVVTDENCVVEVRSRSVTKGLFFQSRLSQEPWDFILALGDDETDESLFRVLPIGSYSVRVGLVPTAARFNADSVETALVLLERLRNGA